jgi:thioredoxin
MVLTKQKEDSLNENDVIKSILENYKTVAVVGLSKDPSKDSYGVAEFLQSEGYRIIPVNPTADQILGEKSFKSLLEMPEDLQRTIEIVDIFRPFADVPPIVDQAIELKKKFGKPLVVWMQLGIINEEAAKKAEAAGLTVVMDRCMRIERRKLDKEEEAELEQIRARKKQELQTKMSENNVGAGPLTLDDAHFDEAVKKYPLMLIDCWAEWCGPCRMVGPIIDELARDYDDRLVVGKLNVDDNPETAGRFGVVSIPTLLIMKNGNEVDRIIGAVPKKLIEERLKRHF